MRSMRWHFGVSLSAGLLSVASSVFAQQPQPAFEVASVRLVVTKATASDLLSGRRRVGMLVSETRVDVPEMSLSELVRRAFRLPSYQISMPEWLDKVLVEIHATIAPDLRQQVPEMLRHLLIARFGIVTHQERRSVPGYLLNVATTGHKLREAPPEANEPTNTERLSDPRAAFDPDAKAKGGAVTRDGLVLKSVTSTITFKANAEGGVVVEISSMTMDDLAQNLAGLAERPVVNRTQLSRSYQVRLDLAGAMLARFSVAGGGAVGSVMPAGLPTELAPANAASDPAGQSSLLSSLNRLGLMLSEERVPVDVVVVDAISATPTEN
jgi:uncharacterized protein (TIGR03435 family)